MPCLGSIWLGVWRILSAGPKTNDFVPLVTKPRSRQNSLGMDGQLSTTSCPKLSGPVHLVKETMIKRKYIHDYQSCSRTYATLCIYHEALSPEEITAQIDLKPDRVVRKGEPSVLGRTISMNGWFRTTQGRTASRDIRSHIALLMKLLSSRKKKLVGLKKKKCELRIMCFWGSVSGNGGPFFDHEFLRELSTFPLDLDFDVWFEGEVETND